MTRFFGLAAIVSAAYGHTGWSAFFILIFIEMRLEQTALSLQLKSIKGTQAPSQETDKVAR